MSLTRFGMSINEYNEFLERKLKHYNTWLMDPKRTYKDGPYPGFPEEIEMVQAREQLRASFVDKIERVKEKKESSAGAPPRKERKKRVKKTSDGGPTKQDRAVEIYKRLNGVKGDVIQMIQAELGMSLAGATTYYYNAKKLA